VINNKIVILGKEKETGIAKEKQCPPRKQNLKAQGLSLEKQA